MKLASTETERIGKWEMVNGKAERDATLRANRMAYDRVFGKDRRQ
jgi:hypothetical protein